MSLEKQCLNQDTISSLVNDYIKTVYRFKWDTKNPTCLHIKNQIVILLGGFYKNILDWYLNNTLDKEKVTSFIQLVSHVIGTGIIQATQNMYGFLLQQNQFLTQDKNQLKMIQLYIQSQIDKNIAQGRKEMDNMIEIFRQRCFEIVLEWQKSSKNMLQMSHGRNAKKIEQLKSQNSWLSHQVTFLTEENSWLKVQISTLESDISKKQKLITQWYHSWKQLNTRVWELEKEKEWILQILWEIEKELWSKKRRLKWTSLNEKITWIFHFIREKQKEETTWQQWFIKQQNFDRIEQNLKEEIWILNNKLSTAKTILKEVNDELYEEQRKLQTFTSTDETKVREILKTHITDYFDFLFHSNEFIAINKQEEFELSIKINFYRLKALNIENPYHIWMNVIKWIKRNYENFYPWQFDNIQYIYRTLENYIHQLEYGSERSQKAIKTYNTINWITE